MRRMSWVLAAGLAIGGIGCGGNDDDGKGSSVSADPESLCTRTLAINAQKSGNCPDIVAPQSQSDCVTSMSRCTPKGLGIEKSYLDCYAKIPTCNSSNQKPYTDALNGCALTALFQGLFTECQIDFDSAKLSP